MTDLARGILSAARTKGVMITTAESCTGGMVSAALTDTAGSSAVFERGFVTYTNAAKMQMLGVRKASLDAYGAVSEQVAREMALGAIAHADAQIAVSITGIAGPGGSDHKPEGRVCFGIAAPEHCQTETVEFGALGRALVRQAACDHALGLLLSTIDATPITGVAQKS
ncbi:damage-inducible protein CinA [Loktanella sp. D2R18]|uniref:CinA family protein n=1 Tax=Rhodobacterales TaxID=204455 RepID=UPI000DEA4391|nr:MULTISPECIES: CinA family protein [Rhodobacterales]MDO6589553.1 CinA family protein [Yoonia sp. 1_MG-2023]RBW44194.1 damage-inducible protein CinA [Loktanella sp. D2R18]